MDARGHWSLELTEMAACMWPSLEDDSMGLVSPFTQIWHPVVKKSEPNCPHNVLSTQNVWE